MTPGGFLCRTFKPLAVVVLALIALAAYAAWRSFDSASALAARRPESHPQTAWAACNRNARDDKASSTFQPLSDRAAAALVTQEPESRPENAKPYRVAGRPLPSLNGYLPTSAQLARFRSSHVSDGRRVLEFNPYFRYVDGRDGLPNPSTDDLIQWAAHKWGIPEDWLRAEYVVESYWDGFQLGDDTTVSSGWYARYPIQARIPGTHNVYESMGITQVKWIADNSVGAGAEPLRWQSTAFNIDYQAAMVRFYYDNPQGARSSWSDTSYVPCQPWHSIGGWFEPYPWGNAGQTQYVARVQHALDEREWVTQGFVDWSPSSLPRGIRLH
ncbi:MAG: hypothetical protein JOZ95_00295 [Solirubrobacterales bacterium]|nr:hypothetical protein [Solirubrobacterales bacterium]